MAKYSEKMEAIRHELFTDLIEHITNQLTDFGLSPEACDQAAISVVDFLAQHWGGQIISIPQDYRRLVAKRDLEMLRWHKGNFYDTAKHFGMSDRGVRKALDRVSKAYEQINQGRLFEDEG